MSSIDSPFLSFTLSGYFASLVFIGLDACFGWMGHSCGSAWFNGVMVDLIGALIEGGSVGEIVSLVKGGCEIECWMVTDGRNGIGRNGIGEWRFYVSVIVG